MVDITDLLQDRGWSRNYLARPEDDCHVQVCGLLRCVAVEGGAGEEAGQEDDLAGPPGDQGDREIGTTCQTLSVEVVIQPCVFYNIG